MQNWDHTCESGKDLELEVVPLALGEDPRSEPVCIVYSGLCNAANC
jgi:hypothetical protein